MSSWMLIRASVTAGTDLSRTLCGGQCFRWFRTPRQTFVGVVHDRAFELAERNNVNRAAKTKVARVASAQLQFRRLNVPAAGYGKAEAEDDERLLAHYLSLDVDVGTLWSEWTAGNPYASHPLVRYLARPVGLDNGTERHSAGGGSGKGAALKRRASEKGNDTTRAAPVAESTLMPPPESPIRHLRQDLHETLFEFICSQNNHVGRITAMVNGLAARYGRHLCSVNLITGEVMQAGQGGDVPGQSRKKAQRKGGAVTRMKPTKSGKEDASADDSAWTHLYAFPGVDQLARATEAELREMGFGYRSKYIVAAAQNVLAFRPEKTETEKAPKRDSRSKTEQVGRTSKAAVKPPTPLAQQPIDASIALQHQSSLAFSFYQHVIRLPTTAEQRAMLLRLHGVGRKVADCVLLFALGRADLVPVDTHMAQVAVEYLVEAGGEDPLAVPSKKPGKRSRSGKPLAKAAHIAAVELGAHVAVVKRWQAKQKAPAKLTAKKQKESTTEREQETASKKTPALTDADHDAIQACFRCLFGPYCGWAHSVLFFNRMRGQ